MAAAFECSICWYAYEPDQGDDVWQIEPGTPFEALPEAWRCPRCDALKEKFFEKGGRSARPDPRVEALVAAYRRIQPRMEGLPIFNSILSIEAVGFTEVQDGLFGALVTPWSINAVLVPVGGAAAPPLGQQRALPGGRFTFLPQRVEGVGAVELASLFSPALEFESQAAAVGTAAEAVRLMLTPPAPDGHSRRELFGLFRRQP